jgi:hypothetical protein
MAPINTAPIRAIEQREGSAMINCRFCSNEPIVYGGSSDRDNPRTVECPRCGSYRVNEQTWRALEAAKLDGAILGGWIREQNAVGITPTIEEQDIEKLRRLKKPGLKERAERYLLAAADRCKTLQTDFDPTREDLVGISYSHDSKETSILVHYLDGEELLNHRASGICRVTPKGHIAADNLRSHRAKSSQAFVAMWFHPDMNAVYSDGLKVGIEDAGYKSMRVDQKEHANKIDDEIIAEIRRSAFLVSDFTGHRGGVYFEAGFAMGLGLPVIWTCRKDHISDLHFDIRQYNCIDWSHPSELATRLRQRIEAMLGRGPVTDHQQVGSS